MGFGRKEPPGEPHLGGRALWGDTVCDWCARLRGKAAAAVARAGPAIRRRKAGQPENGVSSREEVIASGRRALCGTGRPASRSHSIRIMPETAGPLCRLWTRAGP